MPVSTRTHAHVPTVIPTTFDAHVIESSLPTCVSFYTPWSKSAVPLLSRLTEAFSGHLRVAQVNIAAHPDLAARFKIRAVPTYLIFKGGVPIEFIVGIVPDRFVFETVCKALGLCTETATKKRSKSAARWPWTLGLIPG